MKRYKLKDGYLQPDENGVWVSVLDTKDLMKNYAALAAAARELGGAVYNLFELLAKDNSIDIYQSEPELRTAYTNLAALLAQADGKDTNHG